jgi:hypothetical protein
MGVYSDASGNLQIKPNMLDKFILILNHFKTFKKEDLPKFYKWYRIDKSTNDHEIWNVLKNGQEYVYNIDNDSSLKYYYYDELLSFLVLFLEDTFIELHHEDNKITQYKIQDGKLSKRLVSYEKIYDIKFDTDCEKHKIIGRCFDCDYNIIYKNTGYCYNCLDSSEKKEIIKNWEYIEQNYDYNYLIF